MNFTDNRNFEQMYLEAHKQKFCTDCLQLSLLSTNWQEINLHETIFNTIRMLSYAQAQESIEI